MLELRDKLAERFKREEEFDLVQVDYVRKNWDEMVSAKILTTKRASDLVWIEIDRSRTFSVKFTGKDTMWMRRALEVFECVLSDWEVGQV